MSKLTEGPEKGARPRDEVPPPRPAPPPPPLAEPAPVTEPAPSLWAGPTYEYSVFSRNFRRELFIDRVTVRKWLDSIGGDGWLIVQYSSDMTVLEDEKGEYKNHSVTILTARAHRDKEIDKLTELLNLGVLSYEEQDPGERMKLMELWCNQVNEALGD